MSIQDLRVESLSEILNDMGIELDDAQIAKIAEEFAYHLEMEAEIESYQSKGPTQPTFVVADKVQLYKRVWESGGTYMAAHEEKAGFLGDQVYCKETLYIKR